MPEFFKFCPICKSSKISKSISKNFICSDCGFNYYHNVASACAVILKYKEQYVFVVRKFDPAKGTLDLPGGFVDYEESSEEAIKREVKEELNLEISNLKYLTSFPNHYTYDGILYYTLDIIFFSEIESIENISANDDVAEYVLLRKEDVNIEKFGLESIKKAVQFYFEAKI